MARTSEDEVISDDNEAVLAPSAAEVETKVVFGDNGNDLQSLSEVIQKLPSHVLKDLLSIGVCIRCIIRLFGIRGDVYSFSSLSTSILGSFEDQTDLDNKNTYNSPDCKESQLEQLICGLCLGILQFTYSDGKEKLAKYENADEFAVSIAEVVKKEGFQIDSFSLEVSVPAFLLQNEQAIWLFLKGKYGSEPWFQENSVSSCFSSKDALKMSITKPLEQLLGCKSGISAFHIRLTYNHNKASNVAACSIEKEHVLKRRKTEINNSDAVDNSIASGIKCDISMREGEAVIKGCSNNLQATESSRCCKFPVQINEPCHLAVLCSRTPIYFIGRYLKYSRNVSQTRWIIDDERMGETSVEEILGSSILPLCHGDNYKFHAAGREDIDVRMLGSGRPFLVEIQNARCIPSEMAVKEVETKINNSEKKLVGVKNLKVVGSEGWALMREGEAEKQKQYAALVWTSRPIEDKDFDSISSLKDIQIAQRTPIRVLHRRSPLDREKIIHWMKTEKVAGSSQYFLLHLCTQAGTYIKEFVHGDLGRTHPSVGSILGCRAEILQLDVTDVKMDCFPTE